MITLCRRQDGKIAGRAEQVGKAGLSFSSASIGTASQQTGSGIMNVSCDTPVDGPMFGTVETGGSLDEDLSKPTEEESISMREHLTFK